MNDRDKSVTKNGGNSTWFYFLGENPSAEAHVRRELTKAGIGLCEIKESSAAHGIVCLSRIDGGTSDLLANLRQGSSGLIIALTVPPVSLDSEASWRLLDQGASEVLAWNGSSEIVSRILARLERWNTVDELAKYATSRAALAGESSCWRSLIRKIAEVGRFSDSPVLLNGESGTGKELLARVISLVDGRAPKRTDDGSELVVFDCSTIVPELSGSELFGHERGAFTGAVAARDGAFALAHGKTLFLDEIGELPLALQAQLLRAVQEKKYKRVGGNTWQTSNFRLVCATNRNLPQWIDQGKFRLDLYHRISGWVFQTAPLRERRGDILPLARFFLGHFYEDDPSPPLDEAVEAYLLNRDYPGNVRELRHLIQRIAHRHLGTGPITAGDIPEEDRPARGEIHRAWPNAEFEKTLSEAIMLGAKLKEISQITTETAIRLAMKAEGGNLQRAASKLGVTDRALQMRKASGRISEPDSTTGRSSA